MATITDSLVTVFKTLGGPEYRRAFEQAAEANRKLARAEKDRELALPVSRQAAGFARLAQSATQAGLVLLVVRESLQALADVARFTVGPFAESEASLTRVSLQMRNLGNVFPTEELLKFSSAMQTLTGVSDELIAELAVLGAGLGLTQQQIKRAVGVSLNVAAGRPGVKPEDVLQRIVRASSTGRTQGLIGLGIDPAKIKGDIRDIDVLLNELQRHFAGQAQAGRETLIGSLTLLKERFGDLREEMFRLSGTWSTPIINLVSDALEGWVLAFRAINGFLERIGVLAPIDANVRRLGPGGGAAFKGDPEQTEYQGQIAANTRKTADAIGSFGRFLVGGGAAAQGALNIRGLNAALRAGR